MCKGVLLDLDGVVWRGTQMVPQAREVISHLKKRGLRIRYVSNNSLLGLKGMVERFHTLQLPLEEEELILATRVLGRTLARKENRATVYMIGSAGLRLDLEAFGLRVIDQPEEIDYLTDFVVVGSDWDLNFTKLTRALRCLEKGALLAAPNIDLTYPMEDGLFPGTGAIVAAVSAMIKREPDLMIGKPKPDLLLAAVKSLKLSEDECIMVGDSLDTDIKAAEAAGIRSVLVLSGNTRQQDVNKVQTPPWKVIPSIANLPEAINGVPQH